MGCLKAHDCTEISRTTIHRPQDIFIMLLAAKSIDFVLLLIHVRVWKCCLTTAICSSATLITPNAGSSIKAEFLMLSVILLCCRQILYWTTSFIHGITSNSCDAVNTIQETWGFIERFASSVEEWVVCRPMVSNAQKGESDENAIIKNLRMRY